MSAEDMAAVFIRAALTMMGEQQLEQLLTHVDRHRSRNMRESADPYDLVAYRKARRFATPLGTQGPKVEDER